jgi:hypothetical protein
LKKTVFFLLLAFILGFSNLAIAQSCGIEIYFKHLNKASTVKLTLDDKVFFLNKPYFKKVGLKTGKHYLKIESPHYLPYEKQIFLDEGNNVIEIGLQSQKEKGEDLTYSQAVVPYIEETAEYSTPKNKNKHRNPHPHKKNMRFFPKKKEAKVMSKNMGTSILGLKGYIYQPSSLISEDRLSVGYRRFSLKIDEDTKTGNNFYLNYRISPKLEVGGSFLNVEKNLEDVESNDNEFLLSLKREVSYFAGGLYTVSVSVSGDRVNLNNLWGRSWNKNKAYFDINLENTFYDDDTKFKIGLANRFYLNSKWSLILEGKYNLTDSYGMGGIGIEKKIKNFMVSAGFYWSNLEEDVDTYQLGIETVF